MEVSKATELAAQQLIIKDLDCSKTEAEKVIADAKSQAESELTSLKQQRHCAGATSIARAQ